MPRPRKTETQTGATAPPKQRPKNVFKRVPPIPDGYDSDDEHLWRATCSRMLAELDQIWSSDLELVNRYVQINKGLRRISNDISRLETAIDMSDDLGEMSSAMRALNELRKQELFHSGFMRQTFRAIETTVNERHRRLKEKQKQQGGQVGVRQKPARTGVPSNQKSGGPVTWVDRAKKRA